VKVTLLLEEAGWINIGPQDKKLQQKNAMKIFQTINHGDKSWYWGDLPQIKRDINLPQKAILISHEVIMKHRFLHTIPRRCT
jgi:hypothetical protein